MRILKLGVAAMLAAAMGFSGGCIGGAKPEGAKLTKPVAMPPDYPKPRVEAPDRALQQRAIDQIVASTKSQDPFARAHAVEGAKQLPADVRAGVIAASLEDPAPVVRFAGLMSAGDLRLWALQGQAQKLLAADQDKTVQAGAIYLLHRTGNKSYSHTYERFATDKDRAVRANTAMLLGMLGEPSASKVLEYQMHDNDPMVRLQAAESMWRLGNRDVLEYLVSTTISRYPDDRMIAALALAQPRNPQVAEHLRGMLTSNYSEVSLVAARAMGMLGLDEGYGVAMAGVSSPDARQRQLAAMAFGAIGRMDSQQMLGKLLSDNDEDVRIAAASAILQLR